MSVLDQGHDVIGQELYRASQLYSPPAYVKEASQRQLQGAADTPRHAYADQAARMFPLDHPAATWLSAVLFEEQIGGYKQADARAIRKRIDSAAKYWGISSAIDRVRAKVAAAQAGDDLGGLSDDDFVFVLRYDNGAVERHGPLRNSHEVKAAAAWLQRYRDDFVSGDRMRMARNVLTKAAALDVDFDADSAQFLDQAAGFGTCSSDDVRHLLRGRAALLSRRDVKAAADVRAMLETLDQPELDLRDPDLLAKLAAAVEEVDRQTGLARDYGKDLERPEEVLFAITTKTAGDFLGEHVQLLSGSLYKVADLANLRVVDVEDHLGKEIAESMSRDGIHLDGAKIAAVAPTLPMPDARLFDRLVESLKVDAVEKGASVRRSGLTRDDLFALAAAC